MSTKSDNHTKADKSGTSEQSEEEVMQRLFDAVGPRAELPESIKQNWRTAVRAELDDVIRQRRKRRFTRMFGVAASFIFAMLIINLSGIQKQPVEFAKVLRYQGVVDGLEKDGGVYEGAVIQTGTDSYLAMTYYDAIVRLNKDTRVSVYPDSIELTHGELYIDNNSGGDTNDESHVNEKQKASVAIVTASGTVRDIGTQFLVAFEDAELTASVREGAIVVDAGKNRYSATALSDASSSLKLTDTGQAVHFTQPKHGANWDWIHNVTPSFELEGKTALEFLQWAVSEKGLTLEFASEPTRLEAEQTILHGELPKMSIDEAISQIMDSTGLRVIERNSALIVDLR